MRGTRRTTRLLKDAVELAMRGRAVYIVAASQRQKRDIESAIPKAVEELGVKVETPETLSNFDLATMRLRGAHPNCVVLVDHHVIECRFAAVLEMLHRYDADGPEA